MSSQPSDPEREYQLIEKLELRIASADTDAKFESIIQKFLAPLLLKLASDTARNRNLTIKVCQYVNQRLKIDGTIRLPLEPLLKTFREAENAFVKRFALIFIEQALSRQAASDILPELLKSSIPRDQDVDASDVKMWAVAFAYLLQVLPAWKVPDHTTKEDTLLRNQFNLSSNQQRVLSDMLTSFVLFDPKLSISGTQQNEFRPVFERHFRNRSQVIPALAKFLFLSVFGDVDRLAAATVLSVDANATASSLADAMFKQCNFDFESERTVETLFSLFDTGRPKLQTRILTLLTRSQKSTERGTKILEIIESQLLQPSNGLDAAKLRAAIFSYLNWTVRMSKNLGVFSQRLQKVLKEFIELQGWPAMLDVSTSELDLRAKAYEGIGLLAAVKSGHTTSEPSYMLDLIIWLFTSLRCDTARDIRTSIDEALNRILNVTGLVQQIDMNKLKELLIWNVSATEGEEDSTFFLPTRNSTTYAAVRFANKCLPFDDIEARYIDLLALGLNDRREIFEEAARGLDPYWHAANSRITGSSSNDLRFPGFSKFGTEVLGSQYKVDIKQSLVSLTAAVVFARNLIAVEALGLSESAFPLDTGWKAKIDATMLNELTARRRVREYLSNEAHSGIIQLLTSAHYGLSLGSPECADVCLELVALCPNSLLVQLQPSALQQCQKALLNPVLQHRASRIYGILVSLSPQSVEQASTAIEACQNWATSIGVDAVNIRGSLLSAGFTLTRNNLRNPDALHIPIAGKLQELSTSIILEGRDRALKHAAYSVLGQFSLCQMLQPFTEAHSTTLIDTLISDAKKEDEISVACLGRLLNSFKGAIAGEAFESILERIFMLHEVRKAEFHFALGEGLAVTALGFRSSSTIAEFDVDAALPAKGFHTDLFTNLLSRCISDCATTKPSLKKAAGIWLLNLVQCCPDNGLLLPHLQACQTAFGGLLSNRDEVVQETGSRGLGIVYEKGDRNLRDDLVRDLVQSFTGGTAKLSGTVDEDTQLFEAGALPTEGGQSVTTYKDIVSLATEMGDPSLVYRFMNLASNNAIWTSRAAFGRFGLSGVLADSTYLTENRKFYPKLFRYRFDPNPNVQRSMDDIWKALVKDSNKVIEENFDLIMDDLLKHVISGKEWRAREASCAAIADLVQGREVEKFEKYLDTIWQVAFKVLDDVKETVRVAAMKLCRTLTNMLIRNLEVGEGTSKRATTMLNRAIPFLLQQMEGGSAQEVQQYAVVTLLEVIKKCPPRSLQSFSPTILETLILSLSSLEHESVNYLHLNADKYGLTAENLDKMRVSSINASPLTDAIERCLESLDSTPRQAAGQGSPSEGSAPDQNNASPPVVVESMKRLEKVFKTAIGLPSKVGLSRVLITLVVRHHVMSRAYADRFVQSTRKYIIDRNATISVSFSTALAYLLRLASEKEIHATNDYAQKLYFESQELPHRAIAGEIVQATSKVSNDVFMRYASSFLPFAFIGRNDTDEEVRARFEPAWKENVGGSRALNLYLPEISGMIGLHIKSNLWPIRQACCLAVADLVTSMDNTVQLMETEALQLWPVVEEAINGKTWEGKEKVISTFPQFVKRARVLWANKGQIMKTIAVREAKRVNPSYRPHAIAALGEFALVRRDLELDTEVVELLTNVGQGVSEDGDAMEVDGEESSRSRSVEDTWARVMACLFQVLRDTSSSAVLDQAINLVTNAHQLKSKQIDLEIYDGARQFITQATETGDRRAAMAPNGQARAMPETDPISSPNPARNVAPATFWKRLVTATFTADHTRHSSDVEKIRKSRVDLALALAENGLMDSSTRATMSSILTDWARTERSRRLKLDLEKALALIA